MSNLTQIEPEYVYVTIPAEYICVYHRILAMLADYGLDMLKDCKASCTERNSGVIECFNMFNSAVACRTLGKVKEAALIIKYIKAKINQIYKGYDNSTSFIFPVDENGEIKAFVSCGEKPKFEINTDDMKLYEFKTADGIIGDFKLGPEDMSKDSNVISPVKENGLSVTIIPEYISLNGIDRPYAKIAIYYNGERIDVKSTVCQYYFDNKAVKHFTDVTNLTTGLHNFKCVVTYRNKTVIANTDKYYGITN